MKKTVIAMFIGMTSYTAFAGYECQLQLAQMENLTQAIAEKIISVETGGMELKNHGTLFVEQEKKKKKISLTVNAAMDGTQGTEDATLVIMRKQEKKGKTKKIEVISDKFYIKGESKFRGWFDEYKLDISCKVTE